MRLHFVALVISGLKSLVADLGSCLVNGLYPAIIATVDPNGDSAVDIASITHLTKCEFLEASCEFSCFADLTTVWLLVHDTFSA
jgi:hypothetical protein